MIDKSDGAGFKWYGSSVQIPYTTRVCYKSQPSGNQYSSRQTQDGTGYKGAVNVGGTACFTVTQGDSWTTGGIEAYENECSGAPNGTCEQLSYSASCVNSTDIVPIAAPAATIRARAHLVARSNTTCSAVTSSTTYEGASFTLTPVATPPTAQTQAAGSSSYVSWSGSPSTYTLGVSPTDPNKLVSNACSTTTGGSPYAQGLSAPVANTQTLTWEVGLSPLGPWVQTQEGNVFAGGSLTSLLPTSSTPRLFNKNGSAGSPGLVSYGSSFDFDPALGGTGATLVSSKNWLTKDTVSSTNWYEYFKNRFGLLNATTNDNDGLNLGYLTKLPSRSKPYFLQGDVTSALPWSVGDDETLILVIDGSLAINGTMTIDESGPKKNGFIAMIAKNGISVSPAVGVPASSSTSVLDGIYVTGATFSTGDSSNPGTERLVGKGSFIANSFLLQRDLGDTNNLTTAAELFTYNPRLFFTMPDSMREVPVTWQEVAP